MKKKIVVISLVVVSFIMLMFAFMFFLDKQRQLWQIDPLELEEMSKEEIIQTIYTRHQKKDAGIPNFYLIPVFGFFGVVVGATVYYIMTADLEKKDKVIRYNTDLILKMLENDERKVIKKIVMDNGKLQQMEISYMEGFGKVKAHRIIESLVNKGILEKEKMGKQRIIRMKPEFFEMLNEKRN